MRPHRPRGSSTTGSTSSGASLIVPSSLSSSFPSSFFFLPIFVMTMMMLLTTTITRATTTTTTTSMAAAAAPTSCFLRPLLTARHNHVAALMGRSTASGRYGSRRPQQRPPLVATAAAASSTTTSASTSTTSSQPPPTTTRTAALTQVREEMTKRGFDAFIIPSGDPHLSEYPADHFCRRAFISGFDGSAGTAVITQTKALLWTDGRYHLQAEQQLTGEWELMREGQKDVPSISTYLKENMPADAVVGLDPTVHPAKFVQALAKTLHGKKVQVRPLSVAEANPIDVAWATAGGRPPAPQAPVRVHPLSYAGETVASKMAKLKGEMEKEGVDILVAGTLDEVAWLLNIRGEDVPNCPLAVAYAALERRGAESIKAIMFVDDSKLGAVAHMHLLEECQADIRGYSEIFPYLSKAVEAGKKVWLDPDKSNYALIQAASGTATGAPILVNKDKDQPQPQSQANTQPHTDTLISKPSPITLQKALKNHAELKGMHAAHLRDGAAEVEFLAWLDKEVQSRAVCELEIDRVLTNFRSKREKFLGLSFDTIAGSGENGAIIHYRAVEGLCGEMTRGKMLLLDSGAQYEDGTTDVTRTVHFGDPTQEEKICFTRVLQGHIGIDTAIFPEGTPGFVLDAYARRALWQVGLDYAHGTGHGVGAALNVHEGPQGISFNFANQTPLQPGMVLSNEPGYYASGRFGIRIENLLVVVEKEGLGGPGGKDPRKRKFLGFERLTHIPISKRLIEVGLLSKEEVEWVDGYHREVWEKVGPLVSEEGGAREWLREATAPLVV